MALVQRHNPACHGCAERTRQRQGARVDDGGGQTELASNARELGSNESAPDHDDPGGSVPEGVAERQRVVARAEHMKAGQVAVLVGQPPGLCSGCDEESVERHRRPVVESDRTGVYSKPDRIATQQPSCV